MVTARRRLAAFLLLLILLRLLLLQRGEGARGRLSIVQRQQPPSAPARGRLSIVQTEQPSPPSVPDRPPPPEPSPPSHAVVETHSRRPASRRSARHTPRTDAYSTAAISATHAITAAAPMTAAAAATYQATPTSGTSDGAFRSCCADAWRAHWQGSRVEFCDDRGALSSSRLTCHEHAASSGGGGSKKHDSARHDGGAASRS